MITLRDYQEKLVNDLREALRGDSRVIAVSPTGSGKRMIACWLATQICERGKRVGFVTDRKTLVTQMRDECRDHGIDYGLVMADSPRKDSAPVQICSIQTLQRRDWKDIPLADVWIIDEAHKTTEAYKTLLERYPKAKVISFTATPVGSQGRSLVGDLGPIVEPNRNRELISQGWLLPTRVFAPSEPDVKGVSLSNGEFNQTKLGQRVEECTVFADVFRWWKPYSHLQSICFVPRVKFAYALAEQFGYRGYAAETVEAKTSKDARIDIFERFANQEVCVLINVGVLIEGFDCPIASCGIDLTPNRQFRNFWQKVGRVRRPYENQETAIWLDFSGNIWRFPHPDDNPEWPTGEENTQDLIKKKKEAEEKEPWSCPDCGYVLAFWERPLPDGSCRGCGRKPKKLVRRIRMGNGEMKEVPLKEQRKRRKSFQQQQWDAARYKCFWKGCPLHVARKIYTRAVGVAPDSSLRPRPPAEGSNLWHRKADEVYPWMGKKK
jgi:superfamily II DNA or RNA helicase